MSSVRVILDNVTDVCYPGQTIAGKVECNFDEETKLRAVRIKFKGRAKTEWYRSESYGSGKNRKTRRVRYHAEEIYCDAEYNLVQGGEDFTLEAGRHTYPFSYILPPQAPSSYEGLHGNVRYYVKATVDRPWKFDYEGTVGLNLVSPLDLNYMPQLREPVNISVDKTMCSCWCRDSGGALTFNMSLPATGYVPGQDMSIGCHVENMTNVSAENVKFKIIENTEFISHYPSTRTNYQARRIAECREGGIGAHGEKSWTSTITIPPGHFPNLNPCSIINISYILEAEVVVPCPHTNLDSAVPLTIGTVPLSGVSMNFVGGPPPAVSYPVPSDAAPLLPPAPGPYPGAAAPYPPGGSAPYPPGGSAPYPPSGASDYPPGGFPNGYGDKNPSAPPGGPYPQGSAPPPGFSGAPYQPGATTSAPPADSFDFGLDLPSYADAEKSKEKNEKSE